MATKVSTHTAGSWFPSGYYGHYRSKVRTDFVNEYRQLAKPQPPNRFIRRASQPASTHQFSIHDNRNSFMSDASFFEQGLGRRRHPERSGIFDPDFIAWTPDRIPRNSGRPFTSTYRKDFRNQELNVQKLVKRPKSSFDRTLTTTYRTVHGADSPNRDLINAMNNEALMLSTQERQRQAKQKVSDRRETVASCMSWYRTRLPPATMHTDFNQIDIRPTQGTDLAVNCPDRYGYPGTTMATDCNHAAPTPTPETPVPANCE